MKKLSGTLTWSVADVHKICDTFGVRKGWLVDGEGDKFRCPEEVLETIPALPSKSNAKDETKPNNSNVIDQSSLINAAFAAKDEAYASLQKLVDAKEETIQTLRSQLADRDDHIATLKARVAELRRIIDAHDLTDALYKFPTGSAEPSTRKK